jgi:predicted metal-dependent HD superfamily phosphohydrolase
MSTPAPLVREAEAYVSDLLGRRLPAWAVYHTLDHTRDTVATAGMIGRQSGLGKTDLEVVLLAAWFHDTGYLEGPDGHEERSVGMATTFLEERNVQQDRIDQVARCIRATTVPPRPVTLPEQVLCDADVIHVGKKRFFERSSLLRAEMEMRTGNTMTEPDWLRYNIDFVVNHTFHTDYAQSEYAPRRAKNLLALQERLRSLTLGKDGKGRSAGPAMPERGIETMFRVVPKNHLDLAALADHKASILISTSALILSIVLGLLVSKLDSSPHLTVPTLILIVVCLLVLVFSTLATRPQVTSGTFTRDDIMQRKVNLLFFGNFHRSKLEDFEWGMKEMMNDREYLYGSMIKDLYSLGKVLGRKYRYLRIAYSIFMYGLIVTVVAFGTALLLAPPLE